jgi:hypothetical protein
MHQTPAQGGQRPRTPDSSRPEGHTPQTSSTRAHDGFSATKAVHGPPKLALTNSALSSDFWDLTERYERVSEEWKKDALLLRQREKEVVQTGEMQKELTAELRGVHELVLHLREEVRVAASERAQSQSLLHTSQKQCVQLSEELRKMQVRVHVEQLRSQEVEAECRSRLLNLERAQHQTEAQLGDIPKMREVAQAVGDIDERVLSLEGTVADSTARDSSTRVELDQVNRRMRKVEHTKQGDGVQHKDSAVIPTRPLNVPPRTALAHPARQRYASNSGGVAALVRKLETQVECGVMEELSSSWAVTPLHRVELRRLMVTKHALEVVKASRSHILRCEGLRLLNSLAVDQAGTAEILDVHLGGVSIVKRLTDPRSSALERKWSIELLATMCT